MSAKIDVGPTDGTPRPDQSTGPYPMAAAATPGKVPAISVVLATHDRPRRLAAQLEALRAQTLDREHYEVVVVDDGSGTETAALLQREAQRDGVPLRVLRHESSVGPAGARNAGWRAARGELIAFTDDDCVVTPGWLAAGLETARKHAAAVIQGPVAPLPEEVQHYGPFSHTVRVEELGPGFETANIFYPRALLEDLGGFDERNFSGPGGEDTDLAWKAIERGVTAVWAPEALVYHAVTNLGPLGKLRMAARWHESMLPYKRYRTLRGHRVLGVFWNGHHLKLFRAALALILPRRLWWLRWWLAAPYVTHLVERRSGPLLAPYIIVHDLVEVAACVRGSLRYRVLVL